VPVAALKSSVVSSLDDRLNFNSRQTRLFHAEKTMGFE
jgi:hypothetical protein